MASDTLTVRVTNPEQLLAIENAIAAVEDELDVELSTSRGQPGPGEISRPEAIAELAKAYTGLGPEAFADG